MPREKRLRAVFVGPAGVGKTSLVRVLGGLNVILGHESESTVGMCAISIFTNDNVAVEVWDTAGQERYAPMMELYTRDADIIISAHDHINDTGHRQSKAILERLENITNPKRLQTVASWQTKRDLHAASNPSFTSAYIVHQVAHLSALEDPDEVRAMFNDLVNLHLRRQPPTRVPEPEKLLLLGSLNYDDQQQRSRCSGYC